MGKELTLSQQTIAALKSRLNAVMTKGEVTSFASFLQAKYLNERAYPFQSQADLAILNNGVQIARVNHSDIKTTNPNEILKFILAKPEFHLFFVHAKKADTNLAKEAHQIALEFENLADQIVFFEEKLECRVLSSAALNISATLGNDNLSVTLGDDNAFRVKHEAASSAQTLFLALLKQENLNGDKTANLYNYHDALLLFYRTVWPVPDYANNGAWIDFHSIKFR